MDLSIIILNYRSRGLLKQCLKGIYRFKPSRSFECIIVDNASDDTLAEMIDDEFLRHQTATLWDSRYCPIRTIALPVNRGYAHGNNEGIRNANGKFILILNPDIAVFDGSLDTLALYLEAHPTVGMVGPKLRNPDGSIQYSCHAFPAIATPFYRRTILGLTSWGKKDLERYTISHWDHSHDREVDWLMGSALMVRKEALDSVGLLDDRFFMYFEDIDWCRRFWKSGWKVVYVPTATMTHYHQRMSASLSPLSLIRNRPARAHVASAVKYFWKYRNERHE